MVELGAGILMPKLFFQVKRVMRNEALCHWINESMNQCHPVAMEFDLFGERRSPDASGLG